MEERVKLLLISYSLQELLEENDITEEFILTFLVEEGMVDLRRYFDD